MDEVSLLVKLALSAFFVPEPHPEIATQKATISIIVKMFFFIISVCCLLLWQPALSLVIPIIPARLKKIYETKVKKLF